MKPNLLRRGPMRRRLHILRRRREAMLLDLGALVLEMHRHGRFLPDGVARRAAEAVGTDAELRALSRSLEAGDGNPDLVAAGVAGNCPQCGALHTLGAAFCSQCGAALESGALPRKAQLGQDPGLMPEAAPLPRRPITPARPAPTPAAGNGAPGQTPAPEPDEPATVVQPEADTETERPGARQAEPAQPVAAEQPKAAEPEPQEDEEPPQVVRRVAVGGPPAAASRARATRVRQRLNEPSRPSQTLPTGLLAGIAAGVVVIGLGILLLSSGGDDGEPEPERSAQEAPARNEPEPEPDDEPVTPVPESQDDDAGTALEPVEGVTAEAYDPAGDDEEHSAEAPLAVDGDTATVWPTEEYETGSLQKDGVGLVLAPAQALAARGLDIQSPTPGFDVTIYGAEGELPEGVDGDWAQIASEEGVRGRSRIELDAAGNEFAHYLIWITAIPADEGKVEIAETRLLR